MVRLESALLPRDKMSRPFNLVTRRRTTCMECEARERSEFCTLSTPEVEFLDEVKGCVTYDSGQAIFEQGSHAEGIFCIEYGSVVLRRTDADGRSLSVRLIGDQRTIGHRAFFSGQPYSESAEALTEATICFIGRDDIQELLEGNNALGTHLIRRLATESNKAEDARFRMMKQQVRARLAYLLLHLIEREAEVDEHGHSMVVLPLSRGDLAGIVGSRPETITRSIRALEGDGIATFEGRRVTVPDVSRLRRESEIQSD